MTPPRHTIATWATAAGLAFGAIAAASALWTRPASAATAPTCTFTTTMANASSTTNTDGSLVLLAPNGVKATGGGTASLTCSNLPTNTGAIWFTTATTGGYLLIEAGTFSGSAPANFTITQTNLISPMTGTNPGFMSVSYDASLSTLSTQMPSGSPTFTTANQLATATNQLAPATLTTTGSTTTTTYDPSSNLTALGATASSTGAGTIIAIGAAAGVPLGLIGWALHLIIHALRAGR